jgi:hypothetical protein
MIKITNVKTYLKKGKCSMIKKYGFIYIVMILIALSAFIHWHPRKMEQIVSFEREPKIFVVKDKGGYETCNEKTELNLNEELSPLTCVPFKHGRFFLQEGDVLLTYDGYGVIFTYSGGYVYSFTESSKQYKILNKEYVVQIRNQLSDTQKDKKGIHTARYS